MVDGSPTLFPSMYGNRHVATRVLHEKKANTPCLVVTFSVELRHCSAQHCLTLLLSSAIT